MILDTRGGTPLKFDAVLANLEKQTSLKFTMERRQVNVWQLCKADWRTSDIGTD